MDVKETGNPGGQLVLAGDPRQLGPVLRSPLAQKHGLGYSLLERLLTYNSLYKKGPNGYDPQFITKLLRNYRYPCPLLCRSSHVITVAVSWKRGSLCGPLYSYLSWDLAGFWTSGLCTLKFIRAESSWMNLSFSAVQQEISKAGAYSFP